MDRKVKNSILFSDGVLPSIGTYVASLFRRILNPNVFSVLSCSKIQLSSPNWLYGLTKEEEEEEREEFAQKVDSDANTNGAAQDDSMSNGSCDFNWLSQEDDCNEEDIFQRFESDIFCAHDIDYFS